MTVEISRRLRYADRFAVQQADQAVRKDVVRALVEVITNCNDSYRRLEDSGVATAGKIVIQCERKWSNTVIRVFDNAEGMAANDLDNKVGEYGAATSGFTEGKSVRGLWGRGLKDAIFGLGRGSVGAIHDGMFSRCTLSMANSQTTYQREKSIRASRTIKKQCEIVSGNGTVVELVICREGIRVPQFDNLRRSLERHFELRPIMNDPKRTVLLRDTDTRGRIKNEVRLSHKPPVGVEILNEILPVGGEGVSARLHVLRANDPLSTPAEDADFADGGLLVISKGVVLALTLLKFEHNEHAARFYGSITCDHLHELLTTDDSVLTATRDGINWRHPFAKVLRQTVEARLEPLVEEERKRAEAERHNVLDKKLRERLNSALDELNSIASSELGQSTGPGPGPGRNGQIIPKIPLSGFGFVPEYAYIQTGKPAVISLRSAVPGKIEMGSLITIESDNEEVLVLTPQVTIAPRRDFTGIAEAKVELEGRQVGAEAVITATVNGYTAAAMVKVISKRELASDPRPRKEKGGLFRDVVFDPAADPKQRVRFDRSNSNIVIATKAPSISPYLDDSGRGSDTPQGEVLLAELVTEAVCFEIARRGVESGVFLAVSGAEADAIRREHIVLQNKYAHRIHECLVDAEYRGIRVMAGYRKGRPSKHEMMSRAVVPT